MFTDVLQTFLKFSLIILLFIIAFSLGFHALIGEQVNIEDSLHNLELFRIITEYILFLLNWNFRFIENVRNLLLRNDENSRDDDRRV